MQQDAAWHHSLLHRWFVDRPDCSEQQERLSLISKATGGSRQSLSFLLFCTRSLGGPPQMKYFWALWTFTSGFSLCLRQSGTQSVHCFSNTPSLNIQNIKNYHDNRSWNITNLISKKLILDYHVYHFVLLMMKSRKHDDENEKEHNILYMSWTLYLKSQLCTYHLRAVLLSKTFALLSKTSFVDNFILQS